MSASGTAALGVLLAPDGAVLLGWKLRGFGLGRLTVPGGRTLVGESTATAVVREFAEECDLAVVAGGVLAKIAFAFVDDPQLDFDAVVHRLDAATGTLRETSELRPEWFAPTNVPWHSMWPDTALWLPRVLRGETITASFRYQSGAGILLDATVGARHSDND